MQTFFTVNLDPDSLLRPPVEERYGRAIAVERKGFVIDLPTVRTLLRDKPQGFKRLIRLNEIDLPPVDLHFESCNESSGVLTLSINNAIATMSLLLKGASASDEDDAINSFVRRLGEFAHEPIAVDFDLYTRRPLSIRLEALPFGKRPMEIDLLWHEFETAYFNSGPVTSEISTTTRPRLD